MNDPKGANGYTEIPSKRNFTKVILTLNSEQKRILLELPVIGTEKIDGQNFRFGTTEDGTPFIGSRNRIFLLQEDGTFIHTDSGERHPNWDRMTLEQRDAVLLILTELKFMPHPTVVFGELYGPGIGSKFQWPTEQINLVLFEVKIVNRWIPPTEVSNLPFYKHLEWAKIIFNGTLKEILEINIENIQSAYATNPWIEGIVITPIYDEPDWWHYRSHTRLIVKRKTQKHKEMTTEKPRKGKKKVRRSKFTKYINDVRIEHVVEHLIDTGTPIAYEMKDLSVLIPAVLANIAKEENEGKDLPQKERGYLNKKVVQTWNKILDKKAKEILNSE